MPELAKKSAEEKSDGGGNGLEEELQLLLQEAGLESVPIDPMSLEALREFVTQDRNFSYLDETKEAERTASHSAKAPPVSEFKVDPSLKRFSSGLTEPSRDTSLDMASTNDSVAGTFVEVEGASPVENQILQHLHRQTRLLLEMQRRIDDLSTTVDQLRLRGQEQEENFVMQQTGRHPGSAAISAYREYSPEYRRQQATPQATPNPTRTPQAEAQAPPRAVARAAAAGDIRRENRNGNRVGQGDGGIRAVRNAIRNSRLSKIVFLFLALRRRYAQDLDGGLIFKILFMMAVLTARISSSSKRFGNPEWTHKFVLVTFLVVLGFLIQTGYMKYFYVFFFKENYAGRIWNGEDPETILHAPANADAPNNNNNDNHDRPNPAAHPLPRGQQPPNHQRQNNANGNGWRNTFLGGMIPDGQLGGVAGAVQDVVLLFGSFLLSIFPMWQPEGNPNRQQRAQPGQQQQQPGDQGAPGGLGGRPGEVRPPRDPAQAVDDTDSDGNDD